MKFIGLPERETNEKPATEKQIRYLLDLVPWLKERDLRKLGIKQAGYLIEQALKERENDDDNDDVEEDDDEEYFEQPKVRKSSPPKRAGRKKSMGCWFYLFMLALIVFLLGFITMTFAHW